MPNRLFSKASKFKPKGRFELSTFLSFAIVFAVIGLLTLFHSFAAPASNGKSSEAEAPSATQNTTVLADATASGASYIEFKSAPVTPPPTPPTGTTCPTAKHTPGGDDGMGGCWPGAQNTGYPHGLAGDTRTPVTLTTYTGSCTVAAGTNITITSKNVNCSSEGLFVYGTLTVRNSKVKGVIYQNSNSAVLTIEDTEVDGGNQTVFPTMGGAKNITIRRVNAYGGQHTVQCYGNCVVENSWLHDQFEAGTEPHQNAFLSNDGSNHTLRHNTVHCTASGCTGDISFTNDGVTSNAVIDANLFMPTPGSYCIYPGSGPKNNPMYQMTVTNNVFKRGSNNKCGFYGAVYAWDTPNNSPGTTGYLNVWSGNKWEDGTVLNP